MQKYLSLKCLIYVPCLLISLLFMGLTGIEPWVQPDSGGYLAASPLRAPLYPWFLSVWGHQLQVVVWVQWVLGMGAALFFARRLQNVLGMPQGMMVLFFTLALIPLGPPLCFGRVILSEGLAYPLFLLAAATFLTGLLRADLKNFALSLLLITALCLTRGQFLFFYLAFGAVLLGPSRLLIRQRLWLTLMVVLSLGASQLIQRTAQYYKDGHFAGVPFTGSLAVVLPLYLSGPQDGDGLDGDAARLFAQLYPELEEAGFLARHRPPVQPQSTHVEAVYDKIQYHHVFPAFQKLGIEDAYAADRAAVQLALHLTRRNVIERAKLGLWMWLQKWGYPYAFFLISLCGMCVFLLFRNPTTRGWPFILFWTLILEGANLSTVLAVEMALTRYTIYTTILLVSVLTAMAWRVLSRGE